MQLKVPEILAEQSKPMPFLEVSTQAIELHSLHIQSTVFISKASFMPSTARFEIQSFYMQLADAARVKPAGHDHFYKVLRMLAQWELLDEQHDKLFSANLATEELVRGKEASLGHFVDHQAHPYSTFYSANRAGALLHPSSMIL